MIWSEARAGTYPHPPPFFFTGHMGMQKRKVSSLCKSLSRVVARCSYAIYLSRENKDWDRNRELLAEADVPRHPVQDQTTT